MFDVTYLFLSLVDSSKSIIELGKNFPWGSFEENRGVFFMNLTNLAMLDWDLAENGDEKNMDFHYTITKVEEVDIILKQRIMSHPDEFWVAYRTPNGVHAFLLSHKKETWQFAATMNRMNCDSLYTRYCVKRGEFACRISPKIDRKGDYVASY